MRNSGGGHGRKKKLAPMDRFSEYERNFVKTYNHMISSRVVDFAVKQNAGVIKLELLEGFSKDKRNGFILRNWSYFELQTQIEYKAKRMGIDVIYIDPYHTSQTCSGCGHWEDGQRIDQATFVCKSCGEKINADYNAARNIAMSTKEVKKREDCEFYKKHSGSDTAQPTSRLEDEV